MAIITFELAVKYFREWVFEGKQASVLASLRFCINFSLRFSLERFSYDLEMKAREQNRNDKRTEIERFDWFIERTDKRVWLFID